MSKIDELIKKLCPNGVSFVLLSDAFDEIKGMGGVTNKWKDEGNCRFIDYLNVYKHMSVDVFDLPYATVQKLEQDTLQKGDILFTSASETPDECAIEAAIENDIADGIFLDDHLFGLRPNSKYKYMFNTAFLKHYFRSESFRKESLKAVRGVTRFYIAKPAFMKLTIPVPPIEIQSEIARILDSFTELITELNAELLIRKKQYEFYRKLLLNPKSLESYKRVKIKDAFRRIRGTPITAGKMKEIADINGDIDIYAGGETRVKAFEKDIPNANITRVPAVLVQSRGLIDFIYSEKPFTFKNEMWAYTHENNFTVKYLYYIFKSEIDHFRRASGGMGAMPQISLPVTEDYFVLLPDDEKQKRIVKDLGNLEKLCNDVSSGLPAEIEARQKQYEFYRDKLLKFTELESNYDCR